MAKKPVSFRKPGYTSRLTLRSVGNGADAIATSHLLPRSCARRLTWLGFALCRSNQPSTSLKRAHAGCPASPSKQRRQSGGPMPGRPGVTAGPTRHVPCSESRTRRFRIMIKVEPAARKRGRPGIGTARMVNVNGETLPCFRAAGSHDGSTWARRSKAFATGWGRRCQTAIQNDLMP
jgi:hypothetical protein